MARRAGGPLIRPAAFWDSSALVALCATQSSTPEALRWKQHLNIVIWWGTPVEIASALARLLRTGFLDAREWGEAARLSERLARLWYVIEPSPVLRRAAVEIVQRYDLRSGDAWQLAAALEWCGHVPQGRRFLTADQRLRDAAVLSGFDA